ncbi:cysteine protease StiP domain-containing protein, partial [Vibrio splendidus]
MKELTPILGSYSADDCQFLMQEIETEYVSIEEKERRIQTGESHYSEMINKESVPSDSYMALFTEMLSKYDVRLANEVVSLATKIIAMRPESGSEDVPIVLVSLARAGTPIGVLVKRAVEFLGYNAVHYSISIIRDKGIDEVALKHLTDKYTDESLVFIDGWTAKGVITRELKESVRQFNDKNGTLVAPELFVIADIGGTATVCSTQEDYAIPSSILNSTVSGLISR